MPWQTPKTNWAVGDGVSNSDFNRIEENIGYLKDSPALNAPTVTTQASGDSSTKVANTAFVKNNPTTAKAWVNFNGGGTVAIRSSYNVSSITDNGVGDYTINFSTPLNDSSYSMSALAGGNTSNNFVLLPQDYNPSVNFVRIIVTNATTALVDPPVCCINFFGN